VDSSDVNQELLALRADNQALRQQLGDLIEQAQRNQQIMVRHHSFDLVLIGASSLRELIENVFNTLAEMSELDCVTLALLDRQGSLQKILTELKITKEEFPALVLIPNDQGLRLDGNYLRKPALGEYQADLHQSLFAPCEKKPASIAIIPLIRQNKLLGYLSLGSFEQDRFAANMATDFIEHMGYMVAICLENVINNERLTHIGLTDPLTNVNNRRYVEQRMLEEIGRARRQQYNIVCMFLDIDHFKKSTTLTVIKAVMMS